MPKWLPQSGNWFPFRTRYDIKERLGEIWSGILPVVVLDQFWPPEFQERSFAAGGQSWDVAGNNGPAPDSNLATGHFTVALHNPEPSLPGDSVVEALVYRVTGFWGQQSVGGNWAPAIGQPGPLRIYTGLESYFDGSGAATFTRSNQGGVGVGVLGGWLQMGVGPQLDQLKLPTCHLDVGVHDILPIVSVGGVATNAVGPIIPGASSTTTAIAQTDVIFDASWGVPLRLKPGQRLVVQNYDLASAQVIGTNYSTWASFWWIERPWREPLP